MKYYWPLFLLLILLSACDKKPQDISCYHAVREDYTENITVTGSIEAVNKTFLQSPQTMLSTIIWVEEDGTFVHKGDTVCIFENGELSSGLDSYTEDIKKIRAQLEKLEADQSVKIAMLQSEIENNSIQLSINSLDSIQKKFAPPLQQKLISLEQEKANILQEKLEKKYNAQKSIGETEIRGLESRIKLLENQIQRRQSELDQLVLVAPIDGLLLREEMPQIFFMMGNGGAGSIGGKVQEGASTWSRMSVLQIPDLEKMQVIAELSENNFKRTKEGQRVVITVEAKDNLVTTGIIKRKMLTGKQQSRDSKVKTYEALVEIDSCHKQLTPGMNALCDIILNDLKDTLVVPAISVFEENDQKYLYVRQGNKFKKTVIETGYSNGSYSVIKSGLSYDSYIALSKPPKAVIIREKHKNRKKEFMPVDSLEQESDTIQLISRYNEFNYE